jgi:ribosomal protein S18 acetylase RimI-like enzyme
MQILEATLSDARMIAEVHVRTWQTAYDGLLPQPFLSKLSVEKREIQWANSISKQETQLLVAKIQTQIIGWASFGASRENAAPTSEGEIWAIYVLPEYWSTGAGRSLWLNAKNALQRQGYKTCILWVLEGNNRAIRFYQAAGFSMNGGPSKEFVLHEVTYKEYKFSCSLED